MKTYLIKVALRGISPMIWRRLRIQGNTSLADLHYIIQIAMGWDDYYESAAMSGVLKKSGRHFDRNFRLFIVGCSAQFRERRNGWVSWSSECLVPFS